MMRAVSVVQALEEKKKKKKKKNYPQPFSENTSSIPLQNSTNTELRFPSPVKDFKSSF